MKFSLSWLKEHLDTDADIHAVAETLNRIGLEVEGIENPADKLAAFRIAKVLTAAPHPQADKLQVLTVDAGGEPLQVVCGAPNARAGMLGVFGPAGATVPSNGMVLKVAAIRGVESNGMMCSIAELELGDDHDGIIELANDAPVGTVYADWAGRLGWGRSNRSPKCTAWPRLHPSTGATRHQMLQRSTLKAAPHFTRRLYPV